MQKEIYLFQFETQEKANYWMIQTAGKFHKDLVKIDKARSYIEFTDSVYYFWNNARICTGLRNVTRYGPEDLYIILDDPERKRLDTYVEGH